jgi:hypothetical protein
MVTLFVCFLIAKEKAGGFKFDYAQWRGLEQAIGSF